MHIALEDTYKLIAVYEDETKYCNELIDLLYFLKNLDNCNYQANVKDCKEFIEMIKKDFKEENLETAIDFIKETMKELQQKNKKEYKEYSEYMEELERIDNECLSYDELDEYDKWLMDNRFNITEKFLELQVLYHQLEN